MRLKSFLILLLLSSSTAFAQESEIQPLLDELDAKTKQIEQAVQEVKAVSQKIKDKVKTPYTRLGVFKDQSARDLRTLLYTGPNNSVESCAALAKAKALPYFGLQYGVECRADTRYGTYGPAPSTTALMPCSGNAQQTCGAGWVNEIYQIGSAPPPPPPPDTKIDTMEELTAAFSRGGDILCEGIISGNWVVSKPVQLIGAPRTVGIRATKETQSPCELSPLDPTNPVLTFVAGASGSEVIGVNVTVTSTDGTGILAGSTLITVLEGQPSNITFRGMVVRGGPNGALRAFSLHGSNLHVRDSFIHNIWNANRDTQAVWVNNGPGPYSVVNSFLEASGENFMAGGDAARIPGVIPCDILIEGNHFFKPLAWKTAVPKPSVKNLFELKNACRVTVRNNLMENNWRASQEGSSFLLTVRNEGGRMPWSTIQDVLVEFNILRGTPDAFAVNILGHDDNNLPSVQAARITFRHNLFADASNGVRINRGVADSFVWENNTTPAITGNLIYFTGMTQTGGKTPFIFNLNVTKSGTYGINGEGQATNRALAFYADVKSFTGNVVESPSYLSWPTGTTVLPLGQLAPLLDANFKYQPGSAGY